EKLALLQRINDEERVTWQVVYRAPIDNAEILPHSKEWKLQNWRAVDRQPANANKVGYMGIPMILTMLGGPALNFRQTVKTYHVALENSGFDPATMPIVTTSLFFVADTTKEALQGMYPHLDYGFKAIQGQGYPRQQFAQAPDYRDALMVGST